MQIIVKHWKFYLCTLRKIANTQCKCDLWNMGLYFPMTTHGFGLQSYGMICPDVHQIWFVYIICRHNCTSTVVGNRCKTIIVTFRSGNIFCLVYLLTFSEFVTSFSPSRNWFTHLCVVHFPTCRNRNVCDLTENISRLVWIRRLCYSCKL